MSGDRIRTAGRANNFDIAQSRRRMIVRARALFALLIATVCLVSRGRAADPYEIIVRRSEGTSGKLSCTAAGVTNVTCYWKKEKRIPAKTYEGCSTTIMHERGHKAVFIPDVDGFAGIFIHEGKSQKASDGCIIITKENIEKIWSAIPRDKKNITVKVVGE